MNDWQSWAALGIVVFTAMLFLRRAMNNRKKSGCGGSCGCAYKPKKPKAP